MDFVFKEFGKLIKTNGLSLDEIKKEIALLLKKYTEPSDGSDTSEESPLYTSEAEMVRQKAESGGFKAEKIPLPPPEDNKHQILDSVIGNSEKNNGEKRSELMSAAVMRKIQAMRNIDASNFRYFYLQANEEMKFIRQGESVAFVEDNFGQYVCCSVQKPTYDSLTDAQLRTYFTWRTQVRHNIYNDTELAYTRLYCYELLNKIGVNSETAFERLLELLENYKDRPKCLDTELPLWIKDFCAYNNVKAALPAELCEPTLGKAEMELFCGDYKNKLKLISENSNYNIKEKSTLFKQDNIGISESEADAVLENVLENVLSRLCGILTSNGFDFSEIMGFRFEKTGHFRPFSGAIVSLQLYEKMHDFTVSSTERYKASPRSSSYNHEVMVLKPARSFYGFILKAMDKSLREKLKCKYRITSTAALSERDLKDNPLLKKAMETVDIENAVESAVGEYCEKNGITGLLAQRRQKSKNTSREAERLKEFKPIKVEIDTSKLSEIRQKSDEISEKLVAVEEGISEERISMLAERVMDEDFGERIANCSETEMLYSDALEELPISESRPASVSADEGSEALKRALSSVNGIWKEFALGLSAEDIRILKHAADGSLGKYCSEKKLFPQPFIEKINAAALSATGDVVFENDEIISDYKADIMEIISKANPFL